MAGVELKHDSSQHLLLEILQLNFSKNLQYSLKKIQLYVCAVNWKHHRQNYCPKQLKNIQGLLHILCISNYKSRTFLICCYCNFNVYYEGSR